VWRNLTRPTSTLKGSLSSYLDIAKITFEPLLVAINGGTSEGRLVRADGAAVAVLAYVEDDGAGGAGGWFLKAGFGPFGRAGRPVHGVLSILIRPHDRRQKSGARSLLMRLLWHGSGAQEALHCGDGVLIKTKFAADVLSAGGLSPPWTSNARTSQVIELYLPGSIAARNRMPSGAFVLI
jgi:hypothetical protein